MDQNVGKVIPVAIEDEVRESYLNYAMSVIVSRALPDVRDGLKPVHRRILYSMHEMGLRADRPYKKAGRIVGDVLGKYHPHGDQSIYDALVRLAQEFSMRYPVVNGQGNFGSIDGDPPAAMRYTEAKMQKISEELVRDIKKETVDFGPNYDDSLLEPTVLPAAIPYLLVNGASGIAVGMATNLPPHNLREVSEGIIATIDNPEITIEDLNKIIKGPDFPTGGIIFGRRGIRKSFMTGKGKITVRAKFNIETHKSGKEVLIFTELPYQVNKANLIVRIAELIRDKRIEGISELRDESDRDGIRVVVELKRGVIPKVILNQLFSHTNLQVNFNSNCLALVNGRPKLLTLKDMIQCFIDHRKDVVIRRTKFDLRKAEERAHILEGLKIALENIDEVVELIKKSGNVNEARENLMSRFSLSEKQAQAILDMRLQKLTSLETKKIIDELAEVMALIKYLKELLASEQKILGVVKDETRNVSEKYGDDRRTEIIPDEIEEINIEDLIQKEDMVVLISRRGFIKRVPVSAYKQQGRGGKGSKSAKLRDEDIVEHIFIGSTHDHILFMTNAGKAYWLKVHEIPEGSRTSKGHHIKGLLAVTADEEITEVVSLKEFSEEEFIFMLTRNGIVKKVATKQFIRAKTRGIIAIKLDEGDKLDKALLTNGDNEVMLVSKKGKALRFHEENVRAMGRSSRGVCGLKLAKDDEMAGAVCIREGENMFVLATNGYGKRISYSEFMPHGRGTKGQLCYSTSEKTGELVGVIPVYEDDNVMCITTLGKMIKVGLKEIPLQKKNAMGVRVVVIESPDFVVGMARDQNKDDEEEEKSEETLEENVTEEAVIEETADENTEDSSDE